MAIRCIFDKATGCLRSYNTLRDANPDEIVGLWDKDYFPEFGLIYDFVTNTVKEATKDQFIQCMASVAPGSLPGIPTLICGKITREHTFHRNSWARVNYDITPPEHMDPGGALVLREQGLYMLSAVWMIRGIGWCPFLLSQLRINGNPYTTTWKCGVYWSRERCSIHTLLPIRQVPALIELWTYVGNLRPDKPHLRDRIITLIYKDSPDCSGKLHCMKLCSDWKGGDQLP